MTSKPQRRRGPRNSGSACLTSLAKILDRETAVGFADRAVIGGLDAFIERWREELRPLLGDTLVSGISYGGMTPARRSQWAAEVRRRLAGSPSPPPSPARGEGKIRRPRLPTSETASVKGEAKTRKRPGPKPPITLSTSLSQLRFVTKPTVEKLARMGVETLRDLLYLFPSRHIDYAQIRRICDLEVDMDTSVVGRVLWVDRKAIGPPPGAAQALVTDGTGQLEVTWFRQPYLADRLRPGVHLTLSGRVQVFRDRPQLQNPEYEIAAPGGRREGVHAGTILPVYPSTEGLVQRTIRNATKNALRIGLPMVNDPLPNAIREQHGLPKLDDAIQEMHHPGDEADRETARRRLAFDELFVNQLAVQKRRMEWRSRGEGVAIPAARRAEAPFLASLPFTLTEGQRASLEEILSEMGTDVPMSRLLQGEVGSGKTVVAVAALIAVVAAGYQGALMAPTEVLTEQHFLNITSMLGASTDDPIGFEGVRTAHVPGLSRPIRVALLIGSIKPSAKTTVQGLLREGEIDVVVGTHALIEEAVEIPRLALAVVDEQHRFGVQQRAALHGKGIRPHLLAMSATPIPRSLALTLYGDLDLSTLRELPSGRQAISSKWAKSHRDRQEAYELVRSEVAAGRQAFVVCPLIDPSEQIEARAATQEFERVSSDELRGVRTGLLHGRMSLSEKQQVMERFRDHELDVLVATPVIEVGIDISNATVMLIESADRFGLSQLHQLRGRVGRGEHPSCCVLLADDPGQEARKRLSIITSARDGFELSEEDLQLRGPGDYLGTRQSGFPELRIASLSDLDLMAIARQEAIDTLSVDPKLSQPAHALLRHEMQRALERQVSEIS